MIPCSRCGTNPRASELDLLCPDCLRSLPEPVDDFEGGICTRCGLSLVEGYCPNDRCPFADAFQDELFEPWVYPDGDERAYIERLRVGNAAN